MNLIKKIEEVDKHDTLFTTPMLLFTSKPYNDTFDEFYEDEIFPTPKDATANVVTFTRQPNTVGILKTSDAKIYGNISLVHKTTGAIATSVAGGGKSILPLPLRTMWKTKELKINDTLITTSGNFAHIISYVNFLTREVPSNYEESKEINFAYTDTHSNMDSIVGFQDGGNVVNSGGYSRVLGTSAKNLVDDIDTSLFSDGGGEIIVPSTFKLELRFTRVLKEILLTGATHVDLTLANTELALKDLKIKIPIYKPNAQLRSAINLALVERNMEAKFYTTNYRCITENLAAGRTTHQVIDVFNGRCPTRLYILYSPVANWNGAFTHNIFNFPYPHYNDITVSINNNIIAQIKNEVEAYAALRDVLNRKYKEMPFSFDAFKNGYALIGFDLTNNKDSHLAVLPVRPSANVNVNLNFSQATDAGTLIFIGEFRNEIKVGLKTPARLLHDI